MLRRVERLSIDPTSNGGMKFGSGKPLCDGKGDGGLKILFCHKIEL